VHSQLFQLTQLHEVRKVIYMLETVHAEREKEALRSQQQPSSQQQQQQGLASPASVLFGGVPIIRRVQTAATVIAPHQLMTPKKEEKTKDDLKVEEERPSLEFMRRLLSRFMLISFFSYKHRDYYRVYKSLSTLPLYSYPVQEVPVVPSSSPSPPPPLISSTTSPLLSTMFIAFLSFFFSWLSF
jgi:hypothetical protein